MRRILLPKRSLIPKPSGDTVDIDADLPLDAALERFVDACKKWADIDRLRRNSRCAGAA